MRIIFLLTFIVFSNYFYAQKHITISTGDWNNPATWQNGDVPEYTFSDTVFVNHRITFDSILSVHGYLRVDERGGICGQHLLYVYNKMDVFGFFWVDSLDVFGGDLNQTSAYDCISTNGALIHGAGASFSVSNGESFRTGITFDCGDEFMTLSTLEIDALNKLSIYPNPCKDFIIIEENQLDLDFKLCDFSGKTILNGKINSKIDVSQLESGIYFLRILTDGVVIQTQKIVKE
jgi:hypothetical protein